MTRVTFTAGRRGRAELFARDHVLRGARDAVLVRARPRCPPAIDKLRARRRRRSAPRSPRCAAGSRPRSSRRLPAPAPAIAAIPGDAELLRSVGAKLVAAGRDAMLCAPDDAGAATVVLFRAAGSTLDCGALWKQLAARLGGRGGGRADRAEGRLAAPVEDWPALIASLA